MILFTYAVKMKVNLLNIYLFDKHAGLTSSLYPLVMNDRAQKEGYLSHLF